MPANITLRNIPDEIYERIQASAIAHHRSLNGEIIACLEAVLFPAVISATEHLDQARQLRRRLEGKRFDSAEILSAIAQGRP